MKPVRIIVHHSATPDSESASWTAIRRYHVEQRGWRDIGYHFGIERVGPFVEVLVGRMPYESGAHCVGRNHDSLGVCVVGNFNLAPPAADVWRKLLSLLSWLCEVYDIPETMIHGHREFANTSCPGEQFDLSRLRVEVAEFHAKHRQSQ